MINICADVGSIQEFDFRQPIVVDSDFTIIVGHTRCEASKTLGLESVPVHIAEGLSEQHIKANRLAHNRAAEDSECNLELLELELEEISHLITNGFNENKLARILAEVIKGHNDSGEVPDVKDASSIFLGDMIELGHHRLV